VESLRRSLLVGSSPPQISEEEFKRLIDEPERKRRAVEGPCNESEDSADLASSLWESNFVPVKSYLPVGSMLSVWRYSAIPSRASVSENLQVPPNLSIFNGAEYYYDRDLESFTHRTRAPVYSDSEDEEGDDDSSATDSSSGSLRASSLPISSPAGLARVRRSASCPVEAQSDSE